MTVQETIDDLEYLIGGECTDTQHDYIEQIELAVKALKKQIPKKPILDKIQNFQYIPKYTCPTCGGGFTGKGLADYCYHCGQALDWE